MGAGKERVKRRRAAPPREIELKLAGEPEALRGLAAHPMLVGAAPSVEGGELRSVYFDTEDGVLRQAGLSLRIRRKGDAFVQTVKQALGEGTVLDRAEWEHPVAGESLDLEAARGTALKPLLKDGHLKHRLRPAFAVTASRQAFLVERGGALVEIVLDEGEIEAGPERRRFAEAELELKHGEPAALFGLARDLVAAAPMRLSVATKAGRGHALAGVGVSSVKGAAIPLEPGLAAADAFRRIARSCLAQAIANEALLRETGGSAALHQMRVGLRRLRAATSLFKSLLPDDESRRMRDALRALSHELGRVRDLDVEAERLATVPEPAQDDGHAAQTRDLDERRAAARDALLVRLDEAGTRLMILDCAAWIEAGAWLSEESAGAAKARGRSVEAHAAEEIARRWKRVLKRGGHLAEFAAEARHGVRIEIKKLRYGIEFFADLFPGKRVRARRHSALACLERLQDTLGELNDLAMLVMAGPAAEADGDARSPPLLAAAGKDIRRLARIKPFWT